MARVLSMSAPVTMQAHAANYLSERRRLGFGLCSTGYAVRASRAISMVLATTDR
jgi:hypothetical protein